MVKYQLNHHDSHIRHSQFFCSWGPRHGRMPSLTPTAERSATAPSCWMAPWSQTAETVCQQFFGMVISCWHHPRWALGILSLLFQTCSERQLRNATCTCRNNQKHRNAIHEDVRHGSQHCNFNSNQTARMCTPPPTFRADTVLRIAPGTKNPELTLSNLSGAVAWIIH